jgi:hypothetical protein
MTTGPYSGGSPLKLRTVSGDCSVGESTDHAQRSHHWYRPARQRHTYRPPDTPLVRVDPARLDPIVIKRVDNAARAGASPVTTTSSAGD